MNRRSGNWASLAAIALVAGCHGTGERVPGDADDHRPYGGIAPDAVIHVTGTEPFWGGTVEGGAFVYTTSDKPEGVPVAVQRFAGRGGLSFSGTLEGRSLTLAITPSVCSDGMSSRDYPFTAMLLIGAETRRGCAWTGQAGKADAAGRD